MGEEEGLLADIASSPGDETPWLVLADWLEEQGQADRSELVRLSVLLRRGGDDRDRGAREARLRQLVLAGVTLPLPRRRFPLGSGVALDMVLVPPGTFLMGSPPTEARRDADEGPQHPVTLTRAFWLGTTAVTQEQWLRFQQALPGRFRGARLPVDGVAWVDCLAFLAALSARLAPRRFRLPSEAEWEYACRAGTRSPFFFGPSVTSDLVNFDGNYPYGTAAAGPWLERTTPVGSYPPNAFGLFDMHGNVWEWCADWFDEDYYARSPSHDPTGPAKGALRVLRGGSWYSYSWSCRSAGRERFAPESGAGNYGFRVALDHGPEPARRGRRDGKAG